MSRSLRIFLCCQQDLRPHPVPAYRFWSGYFRGALAEAGHTCIEAPGCDWAEGLTVMEAQDRRRWREATWSRMLDWLGAEHRRQRVDLFISYLYPNQVMPEGLATLRQWGIPTVNFFCDNVRLFRRAPAEYGLFSLNWIPEFGALSLYAAAGMATLHAPMPCWIAPQWRTVAPSESLPATFIGTRDREREVLLGEAIDLGLRIDLRGTGWSGEDGVASGPPAGRGLTLVANQVAYARQHGLYALGVKVLRKLAGPRGPARDFSANARPPCIGDDYWRVLRECQVAIGINRFDHPRRISGRPPTYSRLRDIEAPMAGAAYLTEHAPGLELLYEIGTEIETYRSAGELVEKARALSADPGRRRRLREAGQRRALGDHSIARTVERMARQLGVA